MKNKVLLWALSLTSCVFSNVHLIKTETAFSHVLNTKRLVVAYVYFLDEHAESTTVQTIRRIVGQQDMRDYIYKRYEDFFSISERDRYQKASVNFIAINLARGGLDTYSKTLGFVGKDMIVAFDHGRLLTDRLEGEAINDVALRDYVETVFGSVIDERLEKRREHKKQQKAAQENTVTREVVYVEDDRPRVTFGVGLGYPYWGYGYPWGYGWGGGYWGRGYGWAGRGGWNRGGWNRGGWHGGGRGHR